MSETRSFEKPSADGPPINLLSTSDQLAPSQNQFSTASGTFIAPPIALPTRLARNLTTDTVKSALPFIELLPYPVLWIEANYHVKYKNIAAQEVYGSSAQTCYELTHGLGQPCHLGGEPCPKLQAEQGGLPVACAHSHVSESGNQLYMVLAVPVEEHGVIEFHIGLTEIVSRDALTHVQARPFFEQMVRRELSLFERMGLSYALIFVDLDFFKRINDENGHSAGDAALRAVGQTILDQLRDSDLAGRWGGEEFCIFVPGSDKNSTLDIAQRLRRAISAIRLPDPWTHVRITASLGFFSSAESYDFDNAVRQADLAMYRAKYYGGNRVKQAGPCRRGSGALAPHQ